MIRELAHLIDVLRGRVPFMPPLVCLNGHVKRDGNRLEALLLAKGRRLRCPRCYLVMHRKADTDHHIARAAAYYTERGQEP